MASVILINPWIYDFAAYDLWSKPMGLLYIAGYLRNKGLSINVIDCMDKNNPAMINDGHALKPVHRKYGTGKYFREEIPKPDTLNHVPRAYSRYDIHPDIFEKQLKEILGLMMGLPGQSWKSVADTVKFADTSGAMPYLAEYSPLPGTPLWESSLDCSRYDLKSDPIFHNNCLLSCWDEDNLKKVTELKKMVNEIRRT